VIYKIVTLPHPLLRKKTTPVRVVDKKLIKFIKDLKATLDIQEDPEGLGIAANQVAVDQRIFLVKVKNKTKVFINPEIVELSKDLILMTEGCLSIPHLYSEIERPEKVKIKYHTISIDPQNPFRGNLTDLIGENPIEEEYDALTARVIQHEMDHLNGIVFIDHALSQKSKIFRLEKNKEGKEEYVEIKL
jgi:peptide deformylase